MTILYILVGVIAYLLGSIPFGYLLVRIFRGQDIRQSGSGNIGATNVVRSGAKGLGIATLVLDALKGFIAVAIGGMLANVEYPGVQICGNPRMALAMRLMSIAALFAVLGHMFPVWLKFRGGKGVATALGVFCLLFPKAILVSLAVFIVVVVVTRYVSLGSILGAIAFPIAAYFLEHPDRIPLLLTSVITLLVVLKHHQNISRLLSGTENRFGGSKAAGAEKTL
ncbi:MAG TPA: glycerol-3-phosphate 1-O-acyltransferase PlsY [Candidatus Angelobacter sp.]|nr:glycerol-3-phosphate 1-O-acyltransferase PlsY [Candidatus Angelobacter sp.]